MKKCNQVLYFIQKKLITVLVFMAGSFVFVTAEEPMLFIQDIPDNESIKSDSISLLIDPSDDLVVTCIADDGEKERLYGLDISGGYNSVRMIGETGFAVGKSGNRQFLLHPDGAVFGPFSRIRDIQGSPFDRTWAAVVESGRQVYIISTGYKSRVYSEIDALICHKVYGLIFTARKGNNWFMHINYEFFGPYKYKPTLFSDIQKNRGLAYTVPHDNKWYLVPDYGIVHGPYTRIGAASYSVDGGTLSAAVTLQSGEDVVIVNGTEHHFKSVPDTIAVSDGGGRVINIIENDSGSTLYEKDEIIAGPYSEMGSLFFDRQSLKFNYSIKRDNKWYLIQEGLDETGPFDTISEPVFDTSLSKWMITARNADETTVIVNFKTVLASNTVVGLPVLNSSGSWLAWTVEQDGKPKVKFLMLE